MIIIFLLSKQYDEELRIYNMYLNEYVLITNVFFNYLTEHLGL
jgi:hypothetical protein